MQEIWIAIGITALIWFLTTEIKDARNKKAEQAKPEPPKTLGGNEQK